jgi:cytoskeleton protein RodZ
MTHATEQTIATESAPAPVPAVGDVLRRARADLGLSVDAVAQKLRLAPKQILALESEDYEHLPGPTYVRGYLRSYAQLLGLAPETVVGLYNRHPSAARSVDLTKHAPTPQMSADHHVIKITTLVVAGLILGLAAIWWQGRDDGPIKLRKPPADAKVEEGMPAADAVLPREETAAVPAETPAPVATAPASVARTEREALYPLTAPTATAPVAAPAGSRPLVLHFQQDSWADVRDGEQNRLLYSVISAGRVIRLGGTPPFNVYLGNAGGVRIEFHGKAVDVSRYQRGPVARFTLGPGAEHGTP